MGRYGEYRQQRPEPNSPFHRSPCREFKTQIPQQRTAQHVRARQGNRDGLKPSRSDLRQRREDHDP